MSVSELHERALGLISACRKRLAMYPPGHPRLVEMVESLRDAILEYVKKTSTSFVIEALAPAANEQQGAVQKAADGPDEPAIGAFLRRRRVKSLLIKHGVTTDELTRLCTFLAQDDTKAGKPAANAAPFSTQHIRTTPFTPAELALDLSAPVPRKGSEPAVGGARTGGSPEFWESLSPKNQAYMQSALASPEIKRRLEQAKAKLDARSRGALKGAESCVDMLNVILMAAFEDPTLQGARDLTPEVISRLVHGATQFIEQNLDALTARISSRPDGGDPRFLRETLLDAIASNQGVASLAAVVHGDKQRLDFLFRTAQGGAPGAAPLPAGESAAASGGRADDRIVAGQLEAVLAGPAIDFALLRVRLEDTNVLELYITVIFELIARGNLAPNNRMSWSALAESIGQAASAPQKFERVMAQGCAIIRSSQSEPLTAFLLELVLRLGHPGAIARLLDDVVYPHGGFALCAALLKLLEARLPKLTASICCAIVKKGKSELKQLGEDKLLSLAGSIDTVLYWATEAPESLLQPRTLKLALSLHKSHDLFEGFKRHFVSAKEADAVRFVSALPRSVPGIVDILYAAMESPVVKLRNLAIGSLWKSSSLQALNAVSEILKKNNSLNTPDMDETNAAVQSLALFDNAEAVEIRQDILRSRRALCYVYRKEIRKALASLVPEGIEANVVEKQS